MGTGAPVGDGSEGDSAGDSTEGDSGDDTIIDSFNGWLSGIKESIEDAFGNTAESLKGLLEKVASVGTFISNFQEAFLNKASEIWEWSKQNWLNFFLKLAEIRQGILDIPQQIYEKLQELFEMFFVPDEDAMNDRLAALREKFAFINSISGYGEHLISFLQNASGTKAPVFTIDLSEYTGNYSWGNTVVVIDFSWYAKYKPLVDNILAGIIWLTWHWHMYKRIPELIHGQGMTTATAIDITTKKE